MRSTGVVSVGVRELKNRLTAYLKLAKADREVVVTERGKPIAIIQPLQGATLPRSLEARIAALSARGEVSAPDRRLVRRLRRVKVSGRALSGVIITDRR